MNHSSSHDVPAPTQPPEQILDSLARRLHDGTLRSRQIGELGEQYAAAWLESQGWRTLDRNWHCRYGELDVVSRNPMGQIVFVEVKTRRTMRYGTPQEAVTASKQINLRHAAVQWLTAPEHRMPNSGVRFDVVTVVVQETDLCCIISRERSDGHRQRPFRRTDRFESLHRPDSSVRIPWTSLFLHHRPARHLIVEARERVKSACQASGFKWPETRVTVNLSPASMPKKGSSHDLAIAASVLSAAGAIAHDCLAGTIVLGEVNLDGTVLPINGLLPIMLHAREQGIATIIVPYANLDEARLVPDVKAIGVRHVGELIELMGGDADYRIPEATHAVNADVGATGMCPPPGDMSEVMGQHAAKWALEVAAAGGHHLMMTGPPGTGKTMLASRIPGIMSPLNETEQLEVASIRSLCGTLPGYGISDVPPFEAPHHTASTAALVGGGAGLAGRSHHPRASRHPVHGRGSGILGAYAADAARTFGIRICRDFQSERHHILSGSLPTDYGGESLPVRLRVRQRRALHLPRKGPRQVFQPAFRTDPRPYRHPDRGASGGADKSGERSSGDSSHAIRLRVIVARQMAQERFREFGWCCNAQATGTWLRANTSPRPSNWSTAPWRASG